MIRLGMLILCLALLQARTFAAGADVRHPVFAPAVSAADGDRILRAYARLLSLGEEELLALAPERSGFRFCGCPNCEGGAGETQLEWDFSTPHQVRCRFCKTAYPNEKFPERYTVEGYPCYKDAQGREYFFQARAWFERRRYLAGAAFDLATLYHAAGDPRLGRRAALILAQFARHYPNYAVRYEEPFLPKKIYPPDARPPFPLAPYRCAKWSYWAFLDIPNNLILAYDLLFAGGELEKLDAVFGRPVKAMIEDGFFRPAVEFVRAYPETGHNMSPHVYQGLVIAGRVLGEPQWAREGLERTRRFLQERFYADGVWHEGAPSYHRQTADLLSLVFKAAKGFERFNLEADMPFYKKVVRATERLALPDGHVVPVNDTWARTQALPLTRSRPILFPWFGYAILGGGEGEAQFQVHLNWSGGYGHQHLDKLGVMLFAKGRELLPDIGYTRTRLNGWAKSTAGHNTVMIDGRDQREGSEAAPNGGDLLLLETRNEFVNIVEARAPKAYAGLAAEYRRTLIVVRAPPSDVYVVDVFTVAGGSQHDWLLHGSADEDAVVNASLSLADMAGTLLPENAAFAPPVNERDESWRDRSLGFITNLRRALTSEAWRVEFRTKGGAGLRTTLMGGAPTEVFVGRAPSVRRAREDEMLLDKYRMPVVVARRRGAGPLSSVFAAVHEPFEGAPFISEITPFEAGPNAIGLVVRHGEDTDYIVLAPDSAGERAARIGPHELRLKGRFAVIRTKAARPLWLYMLDGRELQWDGLRLESAGRCEGPLAGAYARSSKFDAFLETGPGPEAGDRGAVMIVTHGDGSTHGLEIKDVVAVGGQTWVFPAEDPGFTYSRDASRTESAHFPRRAIPGPCAFAIPRAAFLEAAP